MVGCSFDEAVAVDTALACPDQVGALVLFGSAVSGHRWSEESRALQQSVFGDVENDLEAVTPAEVDLWVVGPDRAGSSAGSSVAGRPYRYRDVVYAASAVRSSLKSSVSQEGAMQRRPAKV